MTEHGWVGRRFGRLTVVAESYPGWRCRCECGNEKVINNMANLKSGATQSCGCLRNERVRKALITHGMHGSPEWHSWTGMRARCGNPNNPAYKNYGGRGITVCERWQDSFANFYADMGPRPEGHSLDRIDNDAGYSPGNCRWADSKTQCNNRRGNIVAGSNCPQGHEWTPENTLIHRRVNGRVQRACRACRNDYRRRWRAASGRH